MGITNNISITINQEAKNNIKTALDTIYANLPQLITLSNEQRQTLPKMGDKTVAFVNKSLEYARQNPDLVPKYLDLNEFAKDVEAINSFSRLFLRWKN